MVSQSGGLGFALFNGGAAVGMGMSYVVSTGNECDLGALEVAAHLLEDASTDVIALLVEGFRPDETLGPVAARATSLGKTLVMAKLGRSDPGRRAAEAHTAHDAGQDEAYQEEFRRLGIVCVDDQQELLDVCFALSRGRRATGLRVGIMTTSGGAGVWLADACAAHGLTVPELDAGLQAELRALLPSYGATRNPVDVTAEVVARAGLARPLQMLVESPQVDAVVVAASLAGPQTLEARTRRDRQHRGLHHQAHRAVLLHHARSGQHRCPHRLRPGLVRQPGPGSPGPTRRGARAVGLDVNLPDAPDRILAARLDPAAPTAGTADRGLS